MTAAGPSTTRELRVVATEQVVGAVVANPDGTVEFRDAARALADMLLQDGWSNGYLYLAEPNDVTSPPPAGATTAAAAGDHWRGQPRDPGGEHGGQWVRSAAGTVLDPAGNVVGYTPEGIYREYGLTVASEAFGDGDLHVSLHEGGEILVTAAMSSTRGGPEGVTVSYVTDRDNVEDLAAMVRVHAGAYSNLDEIEELSDQSPASARTVDDLIDYDVIDEGVVVGHHAGDAVTIYFPKVEDPRQDHLGEDYDAWALEPDVAEALADALESVGGIDPELLGSWGAGSQWELYLWTDFGVSFSDDGGDTWAMEISRYAAEALLAELVELREEGAGAVARRTGGSYVLAPAPDGTVEITDRRSDEHVLTIPSGDVDDVIDALDEATYRARQAGGYDPAWDERGATTAAGFDPGQERDDHGRWTDETPGVRDPLRVAGRIVLRAGERLAGSGSVKDREGTMVLAAAVDTPSGRQVHLGVSIHEDDKRGWRGGHAPAEVTEVDDDEEHTTGTGSDATAVLSAADASLMPEMVDDVIARAAEADKRYRQLAKEEDRLYAELARLESQRYGDDAEQKMRLDASERSHERHQRVRRERMQAAVDRLSPADRARYDELQRRIDEAGADRFEREEQAAAVSGLTVGEYRELMELAKRPYLDWTRAERDRHRELTGREKPLLAEQAAIVWGLTVGEYRELDELDKARSRTPEQQARYEELLGSPRGATAGTPAQTRKLRDEYETYQSAHHSDKLDWAADRERLADLEARARPLDPADEAQLRRVVADHDKVFDELDGLGGYATAAVEVPALNGGAVVIEAVQGEEDGGVTYRVARKPADAGDGWSPSDYFDPFSPTAGGLRKLGALAAELAGGGGGVTGARGPGRRSASDHYPVGVPGGKGGQWRPKGSGMPGLTIPDLRALAGERGVRLPTRGDLGRAPRRDDLVAALEAAEVPGAARPTRSSLDGLTVPRLRELARERGVLVPSRARKADIVGLLERPENQPTPPPATRWESDEPHVGDRSGADPKAVRAGVRERQRLIAKGEGTARLLAEVEELLGDDADDEAIAQRLDERLLEPGQPLAGADPTVLASLRRAHATGDRGKLRAALTRGSRRAGVAPVGRAGQTVPYDPALHEAVGGGASLGADVRVVRRGSSLTLPDGEVVELDRARVVPVPAGRAPTPPDADGRAVGRDVTADAALLDAVGDAAYSDVTYAAHGDPLMGALAARLGYDGPPGRADEARLRREVEAGGTELWRGVASAPGRSAQDMVDDYRAGPMWYGTGTGTAFRANGVYFSTARATADRYVSLGRRGGAVLRAVLRADARVISEADLRERYVAQIRGEGAAARSYVLNDPGRLAMALGYDAVVVGGPGGERWVAVLNRTATLVGEAAAPDPGPRKGLKRPQRGIGSLFTDQEWAAHGRVDATASVRARHTQLSAAHAVAETLSMVDALLDDGAGERARRHNIESRGLRGRDGPPAALVRELLAAVDDRDRLRAVVERVARESGLTPVGAAGDAARFDRTLHERIGGAGIRDGAPVAIVRQGYRWDRPGEGELLVLRPVVEEIDEEEHEQLRREGRARAGTTAPDPEEAARVRQREIDAARGTAQALAEVDELLGNDADDDVVRHRVQRLRSVPDALRQELLDAVGDQAALTAVVGRAAADAGLAPAGGRAGDRTRYDPRVHAPAGGGAPPPAGAPVLVVRPGYTWDRPGEGRIRLGRATVIDLDEDDLRDLDAVERRRRPAVTAARRPGAGTLEEHWTRGEGLARWAANPHPWTTLRDLLRAVPDVARRPGLAERLASTYFRAVFGIWPGQRKKKVRAA